MKVEKVSDANNDMVVGLDKQIKEIREVIELPIKHPEVFESLGISQPKEVLMYGPPGKEKLYLQRHVTIIMIFASSVYMEMKCPKIYR